ncbi:hypothetical protein HPB50_014832 [Hyalomma asiaticum]|uniref:Uncharacterized protein n=1 Tax=Hyalomma asiaticum TaxID=266040 RepID=A0ACB7TKX3_HYAAI|nr:hypothetical protein HPB50_014832 [Hyalomma asiaticum]
MGCCEPCAIRRRYGHADADCVRTYASATGRPKPDDSEDLMDVAETEEAARGTVEEGKRAGPVDASAAPSGEATKGECPVEQQAADEASGSKDSLPGAHTLPASSVGTCRKHVVPGHQRTVGDSAATVETTVKVMADRPASAPMAVESQGPTELQPEKGIALTPAGVTVASTRNHPPSCDDGAQVMVPETEEPPAKTPQGRRSSLRPRPNVPAQS